MCLFVPSALLAVRGLRLSQVVGIYSEVPLWWNYNK